MDKGETLCPYDAPYSCSAQDKSGDHEYTFERDAISAFNVAPRNPPAGSVPPLGDNLSKSTRPERTSFPNENRFGNASFNQHAGNAGASSQFSGPRRNEPPSTFFESGCLLSPSRACNPSSSIASLERQEAKSYNEENERGNDEERKSPITQQGLQRAVRFTKIAEHRDSSRRKPSISIRERKRSKSSYLFLFGCHSL